jgi:hypothetical protein
VVFLRYADHKFQAAAKELEGAGGGRRKIGPADYQARGVLYLPEAARFSALIQLPGGTHRRGNQRRYVGVFYVPRETFLNEVQRSSTSVTRYLPLPRFRPRIRPPNIASVTRLSDSQ